MSGSIRLILYVVLVSAALVLGFLFVRSYHRATARAETSRQDRIEAHDQDAAPGSNAAPVASGPTNPGAVQPVPGPGPATNSPLELTNAGTLSATSAPPLGATNPAAVTGAPPMAAAGVTTNRAAAPPARPPAAAAEPGYSQVMTYGAGLLLVVLVLGLLLSYDFSHFAAARLQAFIFDDEGQAAKSPTYEHAEQLWANENYLEAIQLMRDHLKEHPREIYVAFRIAEIYENNLQNWLAAALEYEEILRCKLPPDRWGWAAIHLANLYSGKLGKPEKAVELLRRILANCGDTPAGRKARERLEGVDPLPAATTDAASTESLEAQPRDDSPPAAPGLPPGFRPKGS